MATDYGKFYDSMPSEFYCGENNCFNTKAEVISADDETCDIDNLRKTPTDDKVPSYAHDGYTRTALNDVCDDTSRFNKNPNWSGWDPLVSIYNKNPDKVDKATIIAMEKCCSRPGSLDKEGTFKCGSLLGKNNVQICADIMVDYCLIDEKNLLTPQCKAYINKDTTSALKDKLRAICPGKLKDKAWNEVCACYYDYNYYDGLAQKIEAVWEGPSGFISRIPECLDPKCSASQYRDTSITATCPPVSFNKCIQNANFDIGSGDIGKLEFKQECKLGADGKQIKLKSNNPQQNSNGTNSSLFNNNIPPPTGGPLPKNNNIEVFLFILFISLLFLGGGYYYYNIPVENTNAAYYYYGGDSKFN